MIRLEHVTKSFRGRRALDDVTLEIRAGEICGLLGHNGAGKSTLIGVVLGQVFADAGEVSVRGVSVRRDRVRALRAVGATFESPAFYEHMSGWENLALLASFSGGATRAELSAAAEFAGLAPRIDEPVRRYSRGMRLRLALAQALLPRPEIVVLDEPMEGLDPLGIRDTRLLIRRLRDEWGATVLFSSHLLGEVEALCERVAILHEGCLVFDGDWRGDVAKPRALEECYLAAIAQP
jgi:ABC-2 type transport system ATP-binding protein